MRGEITESCFTQLCLKMFFLCFCICWKIHALFAVPLPSASCSQMYMLKPSQVKNKTEEWETKVGGGRVLSKREIIKVKRIPPIYKFINIHNLKSQKWVHWTFPIIETRIKIICVDLQKGLSNGKTSDLTANLGEYLEWQSLFKKYSIFISFGIYHAFQIQFIPFMYWPQHWTSCINLRFKSLSTCVSSRAQDGPWFVYTCLTDLLALYWSPEESSAAWTNLSSVVAVLPRPLSTHMAHPRINIFPLPSALAFGCCYFLQNTRHFINMFQILVSNCNI